MKTKPKIHPRSPLGVFLKKIRTKHHSSHTPRRHVTDRALARQARRRGEFTSRQQKREEKAWRREMKAKRAA